MHGYYARGVYLNDADEFRWEEGNGFLSINPHWFWKKIRMEYIDIMQESIKTDNADRRNALLYIEKMLK